MDGAVREKESQAMAAVLVVDDQPDLCTVLVRLLRLCGYDAASAEDGEAALDFVRATPPALVILDVMMPGMNGFDVLAALRADPRTTGLPVVMYSALNDPASRRQAMALGAQDYLVKSMAGYEELRQVIARFAGPAAAF